MALAINSGPSSSGQPKAVTTLDPLSRRQAFRSELRYSIVKVRVSSLICPTKSHKVKFQEITIMSVILRETKTDNLQNKITTFVRLIAFKMTTASGHLFDMT